MIGIRESDDEDGDDDDFDAQDMSESEQMSNDKSSAMLELCWITWIT